MRKWKLLLITAIVLAACWVAAGQDEPSTVFRGGVQVIMAPTTVLDKDGAYVTGIKSSEFRLYDNDKLQEIKVDETYAPLSVVVAIQANHKVESVLPRLKRVGPMLQSLVSGETGEVAVLAFDHSMRPLTDGFTNDPEKLDSAMQKLRAGSMQSALTDAVVEATRLLRSRPKDRRKVLLLVAESLDQGSTMKAREALMNLELHNVMVYALNVSRLYTALTAKPAYPRPDPIPPGARHVPAGGSIAPTEVARTYGGGGMTADFAPAIQEIFRATKSIFVQNPVEIYTRYTGGTEYPFVSQEDLDRALQAVSRELHNQYLITYNPNNKTEGGYHRLRVEVSGVGRGNLEVRTRPGYWLATSN
ncbi:MAG TPA: VWA domain-containing protein [Bryobacteraceae bacterium]|nr:VWA domain-containing protein [Bryobacteraceae bacterium]